MITPKVIVQVAGLQGVQGEKGDSGRGVPEYEGLTEDSVLRTDGKTTFWMPTQYIHIQGTSNSSDTWYIHHGLNKYPSVTVVDSAGTQFVCEVEYVDTNNCILRMNQPMTGKAFLN